MPTQQATVHNSVIVAGRRVVDRGHASVARRLPPSDVDDVDRGPAIRSRFFHWRAGPDKRPTTQVQRIAARLRLTFRFGTLDRSLGDALGADVSLRDGRTSVHVQITADIEV